MAENEEKFEMWAKVDLFGHNHRVGKLGVVNTGVEVLYKLDTPVKDGFVTEMFGKGAIYSILPLSEEAARMLAERLGPPTPISIWDLPESWRAAIHQFEKKQLPAQTAEDDERRVRVADDMEDDREDFEDEDDEDEDEE